LAELSSIDQYFLERTSEANFGLWNALLTVNGILVSAFTLVITTQNPIGKSIIKIAVVSCVLSIILITCNYLMRKYHLIKIGKRLSSDKFDISREEREKEIESSIRKYKITNYIEIITLILLGFETILVVIIVFSF
jgi:hypothetical protein